MCLMYAWHVAISLFLPQGIGLGGALSMDLQWIQNLNKATVISCCLRTRPHFDPVMRYRWESCHLLLPTCPLVSFSNSYLCLALRHRVSKILCSVTVLTLRYKEISRADAKDGCLVLECFLDTIMLCCDVAMIMCHLFGAGNENTEKSTRLFEGM